MTDEKLDFAFYKIRRIKSGDPSAARELLEMFCANVENGSAPSPLTLEFLASAFRRILDGSNANAALGLSKVGRGRPNKIKPTYPILEEYNDAILCAFTVAKHVDSGHKLTIAYGLVAESFGISVMKVRRAWADWRLWAESFVFVEKEMARLRAIGPDELMRRARHECQGEFQTYGAAYAIECPTTTPTDSWTMNKSDPELADEIRRYTESIEWLGKPIISESELRDAYLRGFRNARARVRRAATPRKGTTVTHKTQKRRR